LFKKHLIQNGRFGRHRGYFAKTLPATSRRWHYFIPSFFILGLLGGLALFFPFWPNWVFLNFLRSVYRDTLALYLVLLVLNSFWVLLGSKNILISLLTIPGTFLTHIWYGVQFIRGYFSSALVDSYGRV